MMTWNPGYGMLQKTTTLYCAVLCCGELFSAMVWYIFYFYSYNFIDVFQWVCL